VIKYLPLLVGLVSTVALAGLLVLSPIKTSGGGGSVTPATVGTLNFWMSIQTAASLTLSGSNVTQITDNSGNGNTMTGLTSHLPTYSASAGPNSKAAIAFSQQALDLGSAMVGSTTTAFHWFCVFKFTNQSPTRQVFMASTSSGLSHNFVFQFFYNSGSSQLQIVSSGGTIIAGTMTTDTTNWHVMEVQYNGSGFTTSTNWAVYYDKTLLTNSTAAGGFGSGTVIGTDTNGSIDPGWYFSGSMADMFTYSSILGSTARTSLYTNYFDTVYGLSL
jgi:hypothetical protein